MKFGNYHLTLCALFGTLCLLLSGTEGYVRSHQAFCRQNTLAIYEDCRMCDCPKPNHVAQCYHKTCDLRTKDSGYCPATALELGEFDQCGAETAGTNHVGTCKLDDDCPGPQLCCFDFCYGAVCKNPVPAPDGKPHPGRGYSSPV